MSDADPSRAGKTGPGTPPSLAASPLVLVVDDEPAMVGIIQATLESAGCRVVGARDGVEAIEKARGLELDLLVVDLMMPRMSGAETMRNLRAERPALPVLVVSGLTGGEVRALVPEATTIVHKPFSIAELLDAAGRAIETR
jgi:CheY-like chemotaxis protein